MTTTIESALARLEADTCDLVMLRNAAPALLAVARAAVEVDDNDDTWKEDAFGLALKKLNAALASLAAAVGEEAGT